MNKLKVCVYAICKNEEAFVERWMDSMAEADLIVVTDTGSTDQTVAKLKARGAVVYTDVIQPWRFDVARNISLAHVPEDVDVCICTDLDECFEAGWRKHLEEQWVLGATMGNYIFNWSLKADGSPDTQFVYFKIHSRKDYEWAYPIHECLRYVGAGLEKKVFLSGVVLNHYPDSNKSRGSYLPLLEMAVAEDPECDRMAYYLGREYLYASRWQDCIEMLMKHLALPKAWWKEERCASMRWIAKSYCQLEDYESAYKWYYRAIAEVPQMRDPYIECAQMAYGLEDWVVLYYMTKSALKITKKSDCYVNQGYCWNHTPDDLAAIACYRLGLFEESYEHAKKALEFAPEDERLKRNVEVIGYRVKRHEK